MALGYAKFVHESVPGNEVNTPTLSTKVFYPRLMEVEMDNGPGMLTRDDENINVDEPLASLTETFDPTWSAMSRGYPDFIGMMLTIMLGLPTTTAGNGIITDPDAVAVPTGAFRHVWTAPFGPTGASPKTTQINVAWKDNPVFGLVKGGGIDTFTIDSPESGGMQCKASGPACYADRQSDPGLTPAFEADTINPFLRANLSIPTWLASTATSADLGLVINAPMDAHHTAGSGSKYPDIVYKGDTPIVVSGTMPKELFAAADFDALKSGTTWAAKIKWVSLSIIASAYPYKLFAESTACQYQDGTPEPLSNKRRIGANFGFKFTRAGSTSATLTLVNSTSSYT